MNIIEVDNLSAFYESRQVFKELNFEFNEFSGVLTAFDGKEVIGKSLYYLDSEKITVIFIEPISDIPLADGILRSTLHIAAEKSIMNAYYELGGY